MGLHTSDAFRQHPDGNNDKQIPRRRLCCYAITCSAWLILGQIALIAAGRLRKVPIGRTKPIGRRTNWEML